MWCRDRTFLVTSLSHCFRLSNRSPSRRPNPLLSTGVGGLPERSDYSCWCACDHRELWDVLCHDRSVVGAYRDNTRVGPVHAARPHRLRDEAACAQSSLGSYRRSGRATRFAARLGSGLNDSHLPSIPAAPWSHSQICRRTAGAELRPRSNSRSSRRSAALNVGE